MKKHLLKAVAILLLIVTLVASLVSCKKDVYLVEMEIEDFGVIKMRLLRSSAPESPKMS